MILSVYVLGSSLRIIVAVNTDVMDGGDSGRVERSLIFGVCMYGRKLRSLWKFMGSSLRVIVNLKTDMMAGGDSAEMRLRISASVCTKGNSDSLCLCSLGHLCAIL